MRKLLSSFFLLILMALPAFSAPLVGVTNGSRVTFFDSSTPGTLDRFSADNTGTNEYLNGYQVFDDQGKIVGNLTDITVAPDGTFYGMTQNGNFYRFSDFGRYQNNQLGFKMELIKSNLPAGSVDFVNENSIGILSNQKLSIYDTTNFNLISEQNISNQYAGLSFDNGISYSYSIKFSPSPSHLTIVNGANVITVPNGNAQSDVAIYDSIFYMTVGNNIYTYDGINLVDRGQEAITLQSLDVITPEPSTTLLTGLGLAIMLFKRNRNN